MSTKREGRDRLAARVARLELSAEFLHHEVDLAYRARDSAARERDKWRGERDKWRGEAQSLVDALRLASLWLGDVGAEFRNDKYYEHTALVERALEEAEEKGL